ERPRIVVYPIGQKLERWALGWGVAVFYSLKVSAGRELRGMAGNAELSLGVLHDCAQRNRPPSWRIRKPRVPHVDQEIHPRAHRLMRIGVRRHSVFVSVQLKRRMIGRYAHIVFLAGIKDA